MDEQAQHRESLDWVSAALATVDLFAGLGENARRGLAASSRAVSVRAGQTVVRRGGAGDAFFVVRSGLLEVLDGDDTERVRLLRAGTPFGELALLSGEPRTATVRAVRDSELWLLQKSAFDTLLDADADFGRAVVRALTRLVFESRRVDHRGPASNLVLAVLAMHADAPVAAVVETVRATLSADRVWVCPRPHGPPTGWAGRIEALEGEHSFVVLVAGSERDEWFEFCEREADRVILVARLGSQTVPTASATRADLMLWGPGPPGAVAAALHRISPRTHHSVDAENSGDALARAVRRVTGRSVGLVLSGGGARGVAHVGVLQELSEAGIAVDRVGGTSIGALVGALAALGLSPRTIASTLRRELVERRPFADYGVPRVALIRARRARSMLERLFGTTAIEETPRDFYCVSADLVSAECVVHRRGPLVDAVGASMSLPGIAPPMRDGNRLLVDGGVLDNLPVDVMAAMGEGPVIAVDVLARGTPGARHATRRTGGDHLPTIVETMARSVTLASRSRAERQRLLAALVITPDLGDVGLFDFARFDLIIDAGRRATAVALANADPETLASLGG